MADLEGPAAGYRLGVRPGPDLNLARLCLLGDRDRDRQDAVLVVRLDALGVQRFAEEDLAAVGALRPFPGEDLVALLGPPRPIGLYGQHVALHRALDRFR